MMKHIIQNNRHLICKHIRKYHPGPTRKLNTQNRLFGPKPNGTRLGNLRINAPFGDIIPNHLNDLIASGNAS